MKIHKDICLEEKLLKEIVSVITSNFDVEKIIVYGSRSKKNSKKTSDIDLAIKSMNKPIGVKNLLDEKINTLLKFDVLYLNGLNDDLKNEINKNGVTIYEKTKSSNK